MTTDILFSIAWQCGDKDCKQQWHKATYWIDGDGYTVDNYTDGDHESVEKSDLATPEAQDKSWREYAAYVAATGLDPLSEYMVKHVRKMRERWEFKVNRSIVGPVLLWARHASREYRWNELPEHVRAYLNIEKTAHLKDFPNWNAFAEAVPEAKPMRWFVKHIEYDKPRNPATVRRELIRLARTAA